MIRIAITPPVPRPDEAERITAILLRGWDYVHVRFPDASPGQVRRVVEMVPEELHRRLTLHAHFTDLWAGRMGGIHLNRRWPEAPEGWQGRVSASCHSLDELRAFTGDYATLSPVFESVSKPGYGCGSTLLEQMREHAGEFSRYPVIALGGVTSQNAGLLAGAGFGGYAVLGELATADNIDALGRILDKFDEI